MTNFRCTVDPLTEHIIFQSQLRFVLTFQINLFSNGIKYEKEQKIYDFLHCKGQQPIDVISLECNIPVFQLSPLLLQLEMKGVLKPLPGKLFELI